MVIVYRNANTCFDTRINGIKDVQQLDTIWMFNHLHSNIGVQTLAANLWTGFADEYVWLYAPQNQGIFVGKNPETRMHSHMLFKQTCLKNMCKIKYLFLISCFSVKKLISTSEQRGAPICWSKYTKPISLCFLSSIPEISWRHKSLIEWMSSSLVYLWDQLTVTTVWNTGETGDIYI